MALSVAPLTTAVMNSVATHQAGVASGVNNAVSRLANLLGIAVLGILMTLIFNQTLDEQLAPLDLGPETRQAIDEQRENLAAATAPADIDPTVQTALDQAVTESFVAGFRWVMLAAAVLALAGAFSAGAMIEGKAATVEPAPVVDARLKAET
jgi:hypothetical protein